SSAMPGRATSSCASEPCRITSTPAGTTANARANRARVASSSSRTPAASSASASSWRAAKCSETVSDHAKRALRPVALHLDRLLVGRPVDPLDERLGDAAGRDLPDRLGAHLEVRHLLGRAQRVLVELARRHAHRGPQRAEQRRTAAAQAPAAAVDLRVRAPLVVPEDPPQVLVGVAEPPVLEGRADVVVA